MTPSKKPKIDKRAKDPEQFATDDVPDGEPPPAPDDPEALKFLQEKGWPTK